MNKQHCLRILTLCLTLVAGMISRAAEAGSPIQAKLVESRKIWSEANHSAFTALIRWHDQWYCAFREGDNHVGSQGRLRIITSKDGRNWESAATLTDPVYDLRDANLSITPSGQLMVVGGAQIAEGKGRRTGSFASYSDDGINWTKPEIIVPLGRWMWGVTWHDDAAYGVSYASPEGKGTNSLLKSTDGKAFDMYVKDFFVKDNYPNEARLRFGTDGMGYCLQRCESNPNHAFLGSAQPPYKDWTWYSLERFIGGPNLLELPNKHWVAGGRIFNDKTPKTALLYLDVANPRVVPILELPSGGDTSYPGFVWHDDQLWMSYYSSHEGRTSIYLAVIDIDATPAK